MPNPFPHRKVAIKIDGELHICDLHWSGRSWSKKRRGRRYHFGSDPDRARDRWLAEWPAIVRGVERPSSPREVVTVNTLAADFLRSKFADVERGELAIKTAKSYRAQIFAVCDLVGGVLVEDFGGHHVDSIRGLVDGRSAGTRQHLIVAVRGMFNHGVRRGLIDRTPVALADLRSVPARTMRAARNQARTSRVMPTPQECRMIVEQCPPEIGVMVLLGLNAGLKGGDFVELGPDNITKSAVEWLRPKTKIRQVAPLWPETIALIEAVGLPLRQPINQRGHRNLWHTTAVTRRFQEFVRPLGIEWHQSTLRHVVFSVGSGQDLAATQVVLGQVYASAVGESYASMSWHHRCGSVTGLVREWYLS